MTTKPFLFFRAIAVSLFLTTGLTLCGLTAQADELSQPGDFILRWPFTINANPDQDANKAIDYNPGSKYLNFGQDGTGYLTLPSGGKSIATGLTLVSGNDSQERDPASFTVEGSDDGFNFTLVASNAVPPFTARGQEVDLTFANSAAFRYYRLLFPTLAVPHNGCCMQIAEARLQGTFTGDFSSPPAGIFGQPADATVQNGGTATFTVTANQPNVTYQWSRKTVPIGGANGSSYQTVVSLADDQADYEVTVTAPDNSTVTSRAAILTVVGGTGIFTPGDYVLSVPQFSSGGGEGPEKAIDNNINTKYLNFNVLNTGIQVMPSGGPSVANKISLTSGSDVPGRDPTSFLIQGSTDGVNFSLIASGAVPAFSGRQASQVIPFSNTATSAFYRVIFPTIADAGANSMQISEIQLIGQFTGGTVTAKPALVVDLADVTVGSPNDATFQVAANKPNLTYTWYRDNAEIGAPSSPTYVLGAPTPADATSKFFVVASDSSGSVTSRVASLSVIVGSALFVPSDYLVQLPVGSRSSSDGAVANAIDGNYGSKYLNFATLNTGFFIQPGGQQSVVGGMMLVSANDAPGRDPASFLLQGSNDGTNYVTIASNAVPAFTARQQIQNIGFANSTAYYFYRITFPTVADPNNGCCMQIAEVGLFGDFNSQATPPLAFVSQSQPQDTSVSLNSSFSLYGYATLPGAAYAWY